MKCKLVNGTITVTYIQGTQLWFLGDFGLVFYLIVQALSQACNDLLHGCICKSKCVMYKDIKQSSLAFRKTSQEFNTLCSASFNAGDSCVSSAQELHLWD